jgi:hypothetical protein
MEKFGEEAFGPFGDREEAILQAKEWMKLNYIDELPVILGHAVFPDPGKYVLPPQILDIIEEHIEEAAADDEYGFYEDGIFALQSEREQAQRMLSDFMKEWARKIFRPNCWKLVEKEQLILRLDD